ncbi:ATP-binding protein [Pararhizobium antarcticum]|uniref:ORC1/DEAH AAA+ ATPase domain-containing protein n=1 Tax=Pararhizobium antarcticum TaxID=1798805 RepID=A0A657LWD1_9HYPH|nr:ATP-binding protein [Pararhizobium antarcticum]OJF99972.1 hypothetical protein AX760_11345 [Pararhizobium antarcticum]
MRQKRPANIPARIVETDTVKIARMASKFSLDMGFPVHLIGRPGTGKSSALWHIAQDMGGGYCEVSAQSRSTKGMFQMLLGTLGIADDHKYISDLSDDVYRCFMPINRYCSEAGCFVDVPHFLVVDEVQTLEATALRELLRVQEKCSLGLVIAGNAERLATTRRDAATWAQIESRIGMQRHLPGPSICDCELIGAAFNVEGKDAYAALSAYGTRTNFRDLVQLLETARRMSGPETGHAVGIRLIHLQNALSTLTARTGAMKLLNPEDA